MNTYFKINFEFDKPTVHRRIAERIPLPGADYISVADGVILNTANRNPGYLEVINSGMFSICDSGFIPLYIKWIHGIHYEQYAGSTIFADIVTAGKYRMAFLGGHKHVLDGLRTNLVGMNPDVEGMLFHELPFLPVEEFDYPGIAGIINRDGADIIWVALGAPKQEIFMNRLRPYLDHGVMIAVGAAFRFYSGEDIRRAPEWMINRHMEFIYRLLMEPRKQGRRCFDIIRTLPGLLLAEVRRKRASRRYY